MVAELETWFNRNDLVINVGKIGVMSFHNRQTHFPVKPLVTLNKMTVDYTAEIKFFWHSNNGYAKMAPPYTVTGK